MTKQHQGVRKVAGFVSEVEENNKGRGHLEKVA